MSLTLSRTEIEEWTGYKRPSKQIAVLKSHRVRFNVGPDGYPRVLRSDLENKENQGRKTPNFQALQRVN